MIVLSLLTRFVRRPPDRRANGGAMRRADRLFDIIQVLRRRKLARARDLAERLEVSERTIYRDIRDLMASGVPIDGEAGVGYILRRFGKYNVANRETSGRSVAPPSLLSTTCEVRVDAPQAHAYHAPN